MNAMLAPIFAFGGVPAVFPLFFLVIFAVVVIRIFQAVARGLGDFSTNSGQPMQNEPATVVAKRSEVEGSRNSTGTTYYATFEMSAGHRIEMEVSGRQFGQLAEGDRGELTHQGARFQNFVRQTAKPEPPPMVEPPTRKSLSCEYCGGAIPQGQIKCASCGWTWRPKPVEPAASGG